MLQVRSPVCKGRKGGHCPGGKHETFSFYIFFFERERELEKDKDRELPYPLVHSPVAWARLKPGL